VAYHIGGANSGTGYAGNSSRLAAARISARTGSACMKRRQQNGENAGNNGGASRRKWQVSACAALSALQRNGA